MRPLFLLSLLLLACGGPSSTSTPAAAPPPKAAVSASPPSPSPPPQDTSSATLPSSPSPPQDQQQLYLIHHGTTPWGLRFLNQKLYRRVQDGFEAYQGKGQWRRDDFVSSFPLTEGWQGSYVLGAEGQWPNHLYLAARQKINQIFEYKDQKWKPTTLRYSENLQPWIDGSVIGLLPKQSPDAFTVYGSESPRIPKPTRRAKQRFYCPHRLVIHGYKAKPTGDLVLWGTDCKGASNFPDNYHLERFYPDGRRETLEFPQPSKLIWSDAWSGEPPVLARDPDDLWIPTMQMEPVKAWLLAHYDGKSIQYEKMPFGGNDSFFGADIQSSADGTIWLSFRIGYGEPLQVWARSPEGQWTQWKVPLISEMPGESKSHYNYADIYPIGDELWFEADYYTSGSVMGHAVLCTRDYRKTGKGLPAGP